jgi:hypothetical protein
MTCFSPIQAYRSLTVSANGKRGIVFNPNMGFRDLPLMIPCRQCSGCRLEQSRQWAMRMVHEASLYPDNCFLTLTYNDENLPEGNTLVLEHHQLFMKRFRKKYGKNIRFFHCGEYGDLNGRPHYHYCIFNFDFADKKLYKMSGDHPLYISEILSSLWGLGFCTIGALTFETAAYTARYVMKKVTGVLAPSHYVRLDSSTGELTYLKPEYCTMSRASGLGKGWFDEFHPDVYPSDEVIINTKAVKPPAYYDTQLEKLDPALSTKIKSARVRESRKHVDNNTPARLKVREVVHTARLNQLKRNLDESD